MVFHSTPWICVVLMQWWWVSSVFSAVCWSFLRSIVRIQFRYWPLAHPLNKLKIEHVFFAKTVLQLALVFDWTSCICTCQGTQSRANSGLLLKQSLKSLKLMVFTSCHKPEDNSCKIPWPLSRLVHYMSDVIGTFGSFWRETVVIRNGTWMMSLIVNTPVFGFWVGLFGKKCLVMFTPLDKLGQRWFHYISLRVQRTEVWKVQHGISLDGFGSACPGVGMVLKRSVLESKWGIGAGHKLDPNINCWHGQEN